MTRSKHNGCGKTCGVCKPHKKWPSKAEPVAAVKRQTQDAVQDIPVEDLHPAEVDLIEHDAKCRELGVCVYCEGTLELFALRSGSEDELIPVPCVCVRGKK